MLKVNAGTICGFLARLLLIALCQAVGRGVKESGLTGDSRLGDTVAFQAAIDKCAEAGGGTVYVPEGDYGFVRLQLRSNVILKVEPGTTLLTSPTRAECRQNDRDENLPSVAGPGLSN